MNYRNLYEKINLIIKNSNLVDDAWILKTGEVVLVSKYIEGTFYKSLSLSRFEILPVTYIIESADRYFNNLIDEYRRRDMLYV